MAARIRDAGGAARVEPADLSVHDEVLRLAETVGDIDVLVNNAGTEQRQVPILDRQDDYWRRVIDVNLWAPYVLLREIGRGMAARGRGTIINITSLAGTVRPVPGLAHYAAAKAALEAVTKVAAMELGAYGVRCVAVAPGFVETEHSASVLTPGLRERVLQGIPMGRPGTAEDIAAAVVFLVSGQASFINGQTLLVDGGSTNGAADRAHAIRQPIDRPPPRQAAPKRTS